MCLNGSHSPGGATLRAIDENKVDRNVASPFGPPCIVAESDSLRQLRLFNATLLRSCRLDYGVICVTQSNDVAALLKGFMGQKGESGEPGLHGLPGVKGEVGDHGMPGPIVRITCL